MAHVVGSRRFDGRPTGDEDAAMRAYAAFRRWLSAARGRDDVERRQAVLLQSILVALATSLPVVTLITIAVPDLGRPRDAVLGIVLLEPLFLIPLWLLRSGH